MAFQRSYSKVWWGSDNQLSSAVDGNNIHLAAASGYYTYYNHNKHNSNNNNNNNNNQNNKNNKNNNRNYNSSDNNESSSQEQATYLQDQQMQQQQQQQKQQQQKQFRLGTGNDYHSLDLHSYKVNLSCIEEVDDEQNISKLLFQKHDSPGSLRSQDSGFSDNDESQSTRSLSGRFAANFRPAASLATSPDANLDSSMASPKSTRSIATPPTVIRRVGNSAFYSPLVSVTRRISFNAGTANSPNKAEQQQQTESTETGDWTNDEIVGNVGFDSGDSDGRAAGNNELDDEGTTKLFAQLDSMNLTLSDTSPEKPSDPHVGDSQSYSEAEGHGQGEGEGEMKKKLQVPGWRRKRIVRRQQQHPRAIGDNFEYGKSEKSERQSPPAYNNETVYLGEAPPPPPPYNNETVVFGGADASHEEQTPAETEEDEDEEEETNTNTTLKFDADADLSPLRRNGFMASTSTPNAKAVVGCARPLYTDSILTLAVYPEFENPLLNGHMPAVQAWLGDLRLSYDQEVMSTLQTKSIAQEAFKNLTITTSSVVKLVRQLQQRSLELQSDFERNERILSGSHAVTLHEALTSAAQLLLVIGDFCKVLERRAVFFMDSRIDRRKYEEHLEQIRIVCKDTRYSLERQHYINLDSLLDDVQVLKRYLLITIRLIFDKMIRIIVQSIESCRCDMLLRANINMIATLMNIDYDGFASLTDAFVRNEAVRALLVIVLDHKQTTVRALALRALATICCAPEAIAQLGACGGVEIVRDILMASSSAAPSRGDIERREAVSLLAQITAAWHGPNHRVDGLKACAETIIAGLTELINPSCCPQTLLLCAAALNNLSRMEATSHYSIMSNEAIFNLIAVVDASDGDVSVFLNEQIVSMLHNMSLNKKCHSHLANGIIINFITSVYQTEFYKMYVSRAENEAQHRCIKAILHTLTRLVQDSNCPALGAELAEQWRLPEFLMLANATSLTMAQTALDSSSSSVYGRDTQMAQLARQLLNAHHQQEQFLLQATTAVGSGISSGHQTPEAQININVAGNRATTSTPSPSPSPPGPTQPPPPPPTLQPPTSKMSPRRTPTAAALPTPISGLKFNLTRQESFV